MRVRLTLAATASMLALLAPGAHAAATTVYTGEAAEIGVSSVTLKGSVDPGGQDVSYVFQYGETSAYGAETSPTAAGSGTVAVHVAVPVSGLSAAVAYHYRLLARTPAGTSVFGADRTFTTRRIPLTFTFAVTPPRVSFSSPFTLAGTVAGTGAPGQSLVLQAEPFPYLTGFRDITSPVVADAAGAFSFPVRGLASSSELRVASTTTPIAYSRSMLLPVAVRVTLHVRRSARPGYMRLSGTVAPAQLLAVVRIQRRPPRGGALTVANAIATGRADDRSRFTALAPSGRPGLYRAFAVVSGAEVSGHSAAVKVG